MPTFSISGPNSGCRIPLSSLLEQFGACFEGLQGLVLQSPSPDRGLNSQWHTPKPMGYSRSMCMWREEWAWTCGLACTPDIVGQSFGKEEKECIPRAGSPHVTSSCTDRYRTHKRPFEFFLATFRNCCGLLYKSCFPPFLPGVSLTSYPEPLILCVSRVCVCGGWRGQTACLFSS